MNEKSAFTDPQGFRNPLRDILCPVLKNVVMTIAAARENRRAVIFVSNGWDVTSPKVVMDTETMSMLAKIFELARHLDVPIDTLDPRGLLAPELGLSGSLEQQTPERRKGLDVANRNQQQGNRTFAENTHGSAFVSYAHLTDAVHGLIGDNSNYYLLGFYPSPYVTDGKFHTVDVKVKRPGAHVRAREGYQTEAPPLPTAPPPKLIDALTGGLPSGDLALRAFAAPIAPTARGTNLLLTLDVAYPPVVDARANDHLQIVWVALDPDAKIRASGERNLNVTLDNTGRAPLTLSVDDLLDLPKGHLTLRVAVASRTLETKGTVHVTLDVPALTGAALGATPLFLGVDASADLRVADLTSGASGAPFQPTTRRTFVRGEQLRLFTRAFSPSATDVTAQFRIARGTTTVRSIPVQMTPSTSMKGAIDVHAMLPLDFPAGAYTLELTVKRPKDPPIQRAVPFDMR